MSELEAGNDRTQEKSAEQAQDVVRRSAGRFGRWLLHLLGVILSRVLVAVVVSAVGWWLFMGGGQFLGSKIASITGTGAPASLKSSPVDAAGKLASSLSADAALRSLKKVAPAVYANVPNAADPKIKVEGDEVKYTWDYESGKKSKKHRIILVMSKQGGNVRGLEVK